MARADVRWKNAPEFDSGTECMFWAKTGWKPEDLRGKRVLDAGCGDGRYAAIAARYAKEVLCIDPSEAAIRVMQDRVPEAKGYVDDLLNIKAVPHKHVDMAYALGSLHFTGNTRRAIDEIAKTIKTGGELALWVYGPPIKGYDLLAAEMLHEIMGAVPAEKLYEIFREWAPYVRESYKGAWGPLQQVLKVGSSFDNQRCVDETFEWHGSTHRDWHTEEEIKGWLVGAGFDVDRIGDFALSVRGMNLSHAAIKAHPVIEKYSAPEPAKPKVLMLSDVRGWAFDQNAHDFETYLSDRFNFEHTYIRDWELRKVRVPDMSKFDIVFSPYHRWRVDKFMPWEKTVGSLRSRRLSPDRPFPPSIDDIKIVNSHRAYYTVCRPSFNELILHCPNVSNMTNPVDMRRFRTPTKHGSGDVVFEWNGNAGHSNSTNEDVKGFKTIITPAWHSSEVKIEVAEFSTCKLPFEKMHEFYCKSQVALCASSYEGACAVGSTHVTMADGSTRRIDQISVGDRVLSRDGSVQQVEHQWCEGIPESVVEITTWGGKVFRFTENHQWPVWAWARECACGCGGEVTQGRVWTRNHAGSSGRKVRSIHVQGDKKNTASSYKAILTGYSPLRRMRSDELRPGDFLMIPRKFSEELSEVTTDEARLLGYYIAEGVILEGRCKYYGFEFTFAQHELETWIKDVLQILKNLGIESTTKLYPESHCYRIRTKNPRDGWARCLGDKNATLDSPTSRVARWLDAFGGKLAGHKKLSAEAMSWPIELKRELITGMFRGDGSRSWKVPGATGKGGVSFAVSYCTVSQQLASQVQLILAQLGYGAGISVSEPRVIDLSHLGAKSLSQSSTRYIISVTGAPAIDLARVIWGEDNPSRPTNTRRNPRMTQCRVEEDFVYLPIKSVRVVANDEPVYNLTVSGDHSFLVDNVATYNSSSVMEAMACGLAVIATDVGNHREMQESQIAEYGESGILLVDRSVFSFTCAMEELANDPERVARMGELNRMEIERAWSWEAWAPRFAEFLLKGMR